MLLIKTLSKKIDIGGISLIRAAAKNYNDVVIIPSMAQYNEFYDILVKQNGTTTLAQRHDFAMKAFGVSSNYDTHINAYFQKTN